MINTPCAPTDVGLVQCQPGASQDDIYAELLQHQEGEHLLVQAAKVESQFWG